jgi:hypothetical protein
LVGEVAADYLQAAAINQKLPLLAQQQTLLHQHIALLQQRIALGLASDLDLNEPRHQLVLLQANQQELVHQLQSLRWQLAVLLATSTPALTDTSTLTLPQQLPFTPTGLPADLLRTRPDVRLAEARVLQEAGAEALAAAERLPNFALVGNLVTAGNIARHRNTNEYTLGSIGPLIDIPLFDWGQRRANALAHGHLLQAATQAYRQVILTAYSEVEMTLDEVRLRQQREVDQLIAGQAASLVARQVSIRVKLGLTSPLQEGLSQSVQIDTELAQIDAKAARALSYVALFKALGGASMPTGVAPKP